MIRLLSFRSHDGPGVVTLHIHRIGRYAVQAWTETPAAAGGTRFDLIARADETRLREALRQVTTWRKTPPAHND